MTVLNLTYKGDRNYIQGTEFFTQIAKTLAQLHDGHMTKLAFKSFARHKCFLHLDRPLSGKIIGYGSWLSRTDQELDFWVTETDIDVQERHEFNEEIITAAAEISRKEIYKFGRNEYSTIENIVALTKMLNYHISPDVDGKWVFGQINLSREMPDQFSSIKIKQVSDPSQKFSRNEITVDESLIGEIRFIVGKP